MQIALRNMRSNIMFNRSNPIALGLTGVTLLFGVLLIVASVHIPNATAEMPYTASFGVTDADVDMNDDTTGSGADEPESSATEAEQEEFLDYTWVFPSDPGADGQTLMQLGAQILD
jgi:hypothetical protein